jgi:hypothetical protein
MKASSLFVAGVAVAIVSVAPANAEIGKKPHAYVLKVGCSTAGDIRSPVPTRHQLRWCGHCRANCGQGGRSKASPSIGDPASAMAAIKGRLAQNRLTEPLFYTHHLESADRARFQRC